jgi:hypothetical protein
VSEAEGATEGLITSMVAGVNGQIDQANSIGATAFHYVTDEPSRRVF